VGSKSIKEYPDILKRGVGCQEINSTNYQYEGFTFDLFCDTTWPSANFMYLTYTVDFTSCMQNCVTWNSVMTDKCVGVYWMGGQYGPLGVNGGSECWFYWDMISGQSYLADQDSAQLQGATFPTVIRM